jgi:hypothetical protein
VPPFIDKILISFSLLENSIPIITGIEHDNKLFLTGLQPNIDTTWIMSPSGGWFPKENDNVGYMTVWFDKLFTGSKYNIEIYRLMQDTESDCMFAPGAVQAVMSLQGINDPKFKQPITARIAWIESADKKVRIYYTIWTDKGDQAYVTLDAKFQVTTVERDDGRYTKQGTIQLGDSYTENEELGISLIAVREPGAADTGLPWFELLRAYLIYDALPLTEGVK